MLATSESFEAWVQFFTKLKNADYPLLTVTCDDRGSIAMAARYVFPNVIVQLCYVHFLENIRKLLKTRTDETYRAFFSDIERYIFKEPCLSKEGIERRIRWRAPRHYDDSKKVYVLKYIFEHAEELSGYVIAETRYRAHCPKTTNMIESYNSQLEGRLKTIQGFQGFRTAERWLSAWILRRRLTPFTDCKGKFKKLNGTYSLEHTRRGKMKIKDFFQLK